MKPILFNTDMVRAILAGRKTVTRRVVKPQPVARLAYCMGYKCGKWVYPSKDDYKYFDNESLRLPDDITEEEKNRCWTPPCHAGDILYVRETFGGKIYWSPGLRDDEYIYKADGANCYKWRPSIHMPKEAARLFLRVTALLVERLQDITEEQAKAEGACNGFPFDNYIDGFKCIWNCTIKKSDLALCGWDANPWVWVIEFEQIDKEEVIS